MTRSVAFILLVIAANFFGKGSSRTCFQCVNKVNPECLDPLKNEMKALECNPALKSFTNTQVSKAISGWNWATPIPGEDKCLKIIIHIPVMKESLKYIRRNNISWFPAAHDFNRPENKHDVLIRGCISEDRNQNQICEKIQNDAANSIQVVYCSACDDDECNASTRISSLSVLLSNLLIILPLYLLVN